MMKDRKKRTTMLSGICLAAVICGMALFSAVNVPAQEKADDAPYVMDARNVYRDVLNGKTQFYYVSKEQKAELTDIGSVPGIFSPYSEYAALWRFAFVDLDQDGEREVVLQVTGWRRRRISGAVPAGGQGVRSSLRLSDVYESKSRRDI